MWDYVKQRIITTYWKALTGSSAQIIAASERSSHLVMDLSALSKCCRATSQSIFPIRKALDEKEL